MVEKLDLPTLLSWLWDSANILRGSIDSSDFKNYILRLLFLKRANDVYDEELEFLINHKKMNKDEAEVDILFKIPAEARWGELKKQTENIGLTIDKAFHAIETKNEKLQGVLTATKFGNKERLSDDTLRALLQHFDAHTLRNSNLSTSNLLSNAYEYLIKQFAEDAGKKGGEFYTPPSVAKLLIQLVKPKPGQSVYDPTCGSGSMLIEATRYVAKLPEGITGKSINVSLYGQEKNIDTWAIAKLNMIFHNFIDADLRQGDTLTNPQHVENGKLMLFDRVIGNPPFSQRDWWPLSGKEETSSYNKTVIDNFDRFKYGMPPRGNADLAFLQHMVSTLKQDGKMAVILPHGALFRGNTESIIRQNLLENDLIEGIIGLPAALFYNTGIPASIWVINKNKPDFLRNKVIIIDASNNYKKIKNQNELQETHVEKLVSSYYSNNDVDKYMRIVTFAEIKDNDYNLNIPRYVDTARQEEKINIAEVRYQIKLLEEKEAAIEKKLQTLLNDLGI